MLEFSEKPLARASAVASVPGYPDADGRDRSVAGMRGQALRPRAYRAQTPARLPDHEGGPCLTLISASVTATAWPSSP